MDDIKTSPDMVERFYSSSKSRLSKMRMWLWLGLVAGLGFSAMSWRGSIKAFALSAFFYLLVIAVIDWVYRRQLKTGQAIVTLTDDAIECLHFPGKPKRVRWSEIADVLVESGKGGACIRFQLSAAAGKPDKRNFWSGINYARPAITLSPFSQQDQERLLDAINLRVLRRGATGWRGGVPVTNQLVEEREFQEKLKALAPQPWVTYTLVATNVLIWILTLTAGASVLHSPTDRLLAWGGNAASEAQRGEWWRLLSATFLHSGVVHLTMNMIGLGLAGMTVERIYGHRLFTLIYLGSALMGSAMSLHFSAQQSVSVGASGAVFGVAGALLIAVFQHRKQLPRVFGKQTLSGIGSFVAYSLLQGFDRQGIDNAAHVGGLLGGILLAFMLPERFDMENFRRHVKVRAFAAFVLVCLATVGIAASAPSATYDQRKLIAGQVLFSKALKELDVAVKSLQQEQRDVANGKMTERESDERSRSLHAPVFRQISSDLREVSLRPGDPRESFLNDIRRFADLLAESLAMESVLKEDSGKLEPADPERQKAIEAELVEVGARIKQWNETVQTKQKR